MTILQRQNERYCCWPRIKAKLAVFKVMRQEYCGIGCRPIFGELCET